METDCKVGKSYGLYLTIDADIAAMIQRGECDTDVCVNIKGVVKEFTWDEFVSKLGFQEKE